MHLSRLLYKIHPVRASLQANLRFIPDHLKFFLHGHGEAWRIFTHMTVQERILLYRFASNKPPGATFVEIGSYLGASTCFLAAAAKDRGRGVRVHCVDTWQNDGMSEGYRDTLEEFKANTKRYREQIVLHRDLSVQVAQTFKEDIDLLFIDGDHSYEACRSDALAWIPHLKPGGTLVMHDYGWAEGVRNVISEIVVPLQIDTPLILANMYSVCIDSRR